jgi:hypothetical protein
MQVYSNLNRNLSRVGRSCCKTWGKGWRVHRLWQRFTIVRTPYIRYSRPATTKKIFKNIFRPFFPRCTFLFYLFIILFVQVVTLTIERGSPGWKLKANCFGLLPSLDLRYTINKCRPSLHHNAHDMHFFFAIWTLSRWLFLDGNASVRAELDDSAFYHSVP